MSWLAVAHVSLYAAVAYAGMMVGRSDTRLGCQDKLDDAYDRGWDESALAAAGEPDDDPDTVVIDSGRVAAGDGPATPPGPDRLPDAAERGAMLAELGAETERPASDTEQFRAVFSRADGLERECLMTWDLGRRFDRSRPKYLRESGISEKRIRELLGAD